MREWVRSPGLRPSASRVLLALVAFAWSTAAAALEPTDDHRDQFGLTAALGASYDTGADPKHVSDYIPGLEPILEVGGTLAVTDGGDEATLRLRLTGGGVLGPALLGGYRGYFGYDDFKTFFVADLFLTSWPFWGAGAHGGFGAQLDLGRHAGLFAELGGGATLGAAVLTSFDGQLGGQLRF